MARLPPGSAPVPSHFPLLSPVLTTFPFLHAHQTGPPQQSWRIERQFEDLEYLEQCLSGGGRSAGVILPPLPPRPAADPQQAEMRSRKQLGADTALLLGDDWQRDCRLMER